VPIYQKHLLRCEGVFQRVYLDQYLTTIAPTTLTPPLCVYHREQAIEVSNIDVHMPVPICDEKGLYEPLQCDRMKKYCWCVNIHNGVKRKIFFKIKKEVIQSIRLKIRVKINFHCISSHINHESMFDFRLNLTK
jgi:hypothetical protein